MKRGLTKQAVLPVNARTVLANHHVLVNKQENRHRTGHERYLLLGPDGFDVLGERHDKRSESRRPEINDARV